MGDENSSYLDQAKSYLINYFFDDDDIGIEVETVMNNMSEDNKRKVETVIKKEIFKRYGLLIVIIDSMVFASGVIVGYIVFKPGKRKRKRYNNK